MLSVFKKVQAAVHILTNAGEDSALEECFSWEDEPVLTLNVSDICTYVPSLPGIPWGRMAEICANTVSPVYHAVKDTIAYDVENLTQLMAELDAHSMADLDLSVCETAAEEALPPFPAAGPSQCVPSSSVIPVKEGRRLYRGRRYSDPELDDVLTIPSSDPSIPTIIITPCPSQPHDRSCLVPYQDVSFGNKLAVPTHPVINEAFPPLLPQPVPYIERWRFKDGHWWAVLPTPEEQSTRGMFSRPVARRRRVDNWLRHARTRRFSHSAM